MLFRLSSVFAVDVWGSFSLAGLISSLLPLMFGLGLAPLLFGLRLAAFGLG